MQATEAEEERENCANAGQNTASKAKRPTSENRVTAARRGCFPSACDATQHTGSPNARAPMTALERELHALQASRPAGSPLPLHRLPPWPDFGNSHCPTTGRSSSCRPAQLAPCCRCHRRLGVECGHLAATVFRLCTGAAISVQPQCSVIAHLVRRRELHHTLNV